MNPTELKTKKDYVRYYLKEYMDNCHKETPPTFPAKQVIIIKKLCENHPDLFYYISKNQKKPKKTKAKFQLLGKDISAACKDLKIIKGNIGSDKKKRYHYQNGRASNYYNTPDYKSLNINIQILEIDAFTLLRVPVEYSILVAGAINDKFGPTHVYCHANGSILLLFYTDKVSGYSLSDITEYLNEVFGSKLSPD